MHLKQIYLYMVIDALLDNSDYLQLLLSHGLPTGKHMKDPVMCITERRSKMLSMQSLHKSRNISLNGTLQETFFVEKSYH